MRPEWANSRKFPKLKMGTVPNAPKLVTESQDGGKGRGSKWSVDTVDVVYTWKYGGPHILITFCANEMKLCVYKL